MSKVLVLGSAGTVGYGIALAFSRRGYDVYGVVRSEEKGKLLAKNEITPIVVSNVQDLASWESHAKAADIIVEAVGDRQDHSTTKVLQTALVAIMKQYKEKIVLFTSGYWVHGPSQPGSPAITETSSTENSPAFIKYKSVPTENAYLEAGGIVIRPGMLYGRGGSATGMMFNAFESGKGEIIGDGRNFWSTIHADDLGEAYVNAAEKHQITRGQTYIIVGQVESVGDMARAMANIVGFKGEVKFVAPTNPIFECLAMSQRASSAKAHAQLNWYPKKPSFIDGVSVYYKAYKANN